MSETHYVYRINDPVTREFYFGVRTCEGSPDDDSYMGSYRAWTPEDPERLEKWVLRDDFQTREEANQYERDLLIIYIDDELNRNYHIPGVGYHTKGLQRSDEWRRKISEAHKGKTVSEETKYRISEAKKGIPTGPRGPLSEKHKQKLSISKKRYRNLTEYQTGEKHPRSKLTWKDINKIRELYATGDYKQKDIAKRFSVDPSHISDIVNDKRWKTKTIPN